MLLNVLSRINAKGKAHNKMPQGEIRGCSSLVTLLLPHVLWQLNEMLKYQLYRGNYNWALKRSPPRLSVDCKSKIVLASCIPSKVLFWQKKNAVLPRKGYPTIQYWSLRVGWRASRDSGDHVLWCFWSVITRVMTSCGVRGCVYMAVVLVCVRLETQHQRTTVGFCTNEQSSFSGLDPD